MLAFLRIHGFALSILVGLLLGFGGSDDLRKKAEQGEAEAQFWLGWKYLEGEGVAKDVAEAVKWFRKAADRGHVDAQSTLGVMYASGEGVTKDATEAVKWFRKAAVQGDLDAQRILGVMYVSGEGVAEDNAEAVKRFCMARKRVWQRMMRHLM